MNIQVVSSYFRGLLSWVSIRLEFALVVLWTGGGVWCELRTRWDILLRWFKQVAFGADRAFANKGIDQPVYADELAIISLLDRID